MKVYFRREFAGNWTELHEPVEEKVMHPSNM